MVAGLCVKNTFPSSFLSSLPSLLSPPSPTPLSAPPPFPARLPLCLAPKQMAVLAYQTEKAIYAGVAARVIFLNTSPIIKAFILSSDQHCSSGKDLQQPRTQGIFRYPKMIAEDHLGRPIILG